MVCPLYRECPLLRDSNCIILIGRLKFGDLVLSIIERCLIQCPLFGVSVKRDSTVCRILRFWLIMNLVTISCFCTCLIFIQSYIFNFCIYFKCFFLYLFLSIFSFTEINKKKRYILLRKKLATKLYQNFFLSIMMQIKSTRVLTLSTYIAFLYKTMFSTSPTYMYC